MNKQVFWSGIGMQLAQLLFATIAVLSLADWSWFKLRYVAYATIGLVFILYNVGSWKLILNGMKGGKN